MTKKYWSLIESPFQKFAAWVDEEGRLLRFNLRATGAAKVDPGSGEQFPQAGRGPAPGDAICQWQAPRIRFRTGGGRAGVRQEGLGGAAGHSLRHHHQLWRDRQDASAIPRRRAPWARPMAPIPIALIVPCHRVIGADGSLTGYGGGLPLKRKLLEHEARVCGTQARSVFREPRVTPSSRSSGRATRSIKRRHQENADQQARDQAGDDDQGERLLGIRADAGGQRRRQQAQRRHQRRHHDRAQPQDRAFADGLGRAACRPRRSSLT